MKASKAGSVLLLIGGIITLLVVILIVVLAIMAFAGVGEGDGKFGGVVLLLIGIVALVVAILKFWASKLMKVPETTMKGGIIALILGFIGGDLLSLAGGIIGIVQGGKD